MPLSSPSRNRDHAHKETAHQVPEPDNCSVCRKIVNLDEEIERISATLRNLYSQRDGFKNLPDLYHSTTFDRLPVEIISHIFTSYTTDSERATAPLTLGAVCQKWRSIAWSTTSLWSSLSLCISDPHSITDTRLELIQDWLYRSGQTLLTISIQLSRRPWESEFATLSLLMGIIDRHAHRWYSVHLHLPVIVLGCLFSLACPSPHLQNLVLTWRHKETLPLSALMHLAPRSVRIRSLQLHAFYLEWKNVIILDIDNLPVDDLFHVLQCASNLRQCSVECVRTKDSISWSLSFVHITHTRLESLSIGFDKVATEERFLDNVTLPALKHLSHTRGVSFTNQGRPLAPFLKRSNCRLETLSLSNTQYRAEDFGDIARAVPSLERLSVIEAFVPGPNNIHSISRALLEHEMQSVPSSALPLLPSLRFVDWTDIGLPWLIIQSLIFPMRHLHRSARPLEEVAFHCKAQPDLILSTDAEPIVQLVDCCIPSSMKIKVKQEGDRLTVMLLRSETIGVEYNGTELVPDEILAQYKANRQ